MIRSRQLLPCPEDCPSRIYSLMIECWHEVPTRRPAFPEVHARLRSWESLVSYCNPSGLNSTSHSGSTHHSGSQRSSTGPSNNTGSTQLSGNAPTAPSAFQQQQQGTNTVATSTVQTPSSVGSYPVTFPNPHVAHFNGGPSAGVNSFNKMIPQHQVIMNSRSNPTNPAQLVVRLPPPGSPFGKMTETKISNI